jgi:hypothetical protein
MEFKNPSITLLPGEKIPSDWDIKLLGGKYHCYNNLTGRKLVLDNLKEFNRLISNRD